MKKNVKHFIIWSIVITLASFGWLCVKYYDSAGVKLYDGQGQEKIEFIRWHFLAHSDAAEDQLIKEKVKDAVMAEAVHWFAQANDIAECRAILAQSLPRIKLIAENVLKESGAPYSVRIYYGPAYFSERKINKSSLAAAKEPVLTAGSYDSLRLVIGAGAGHNWWCLLFPPLSPGSEVVFEVPPQSEAGESAETAKKKKDDESRLSVKPTFKLLEIFNKDNGQEGSVNGM